MKGYYDHEANCTIRILLTILSFCSSFIHITVSMGSSLRSVLVIIIKVFSFFPPIKKVSQISLCYGGSTLKRLTVIAVGVVVVDIVFVIVIVVTVRNV